MKRSKIETEFMTSLIFLIIFCIIFSCGNSGDKSIGQTIISNNNIPGYDLAKPDLRIILPAILHEISGISVIDNMTVACVQDENGLVFIFDLDKKEITKHLAFHTDGDYEGLAVAGNNIFILRSDGLIFEIQNYKSGEYLRNVLPVAVKPAEYEGLCYDRENNRLLIAPKRFSGKGSDGGKDHPFFALDLNSGSLSGQPVYNFNVSKIKQFASENKAHIPGKSKKKGGSDKPDIKFRPSAIGIHPLTKDLFVISAMDHMLYVFNMSGKLTFLTGLDPEIFNMPEGITFFSNGDMLISNEGQTGSATLLRFNYKKD